MFAIALWDGRTRTLIAARDRAGEKPLYWTSRRGLLLASEVKALLVRPGGGARARRRGLDQFLTYEYIIAPRTILKVCTSCRRELPDLSRRSRSRSRVTGTRPLCHSARVERRRGG
jgi:asparagine synthetase B (glutamine-hydrolysing)